MTSSASRLGTVQNRTTGKISRAKRSSGRNGTLAAGLGAAVFGMGIQTLAITGVVSSLVGAAALGVCSVLNPLTLILALFALLSWFGIEALQAAGGESGLNGVDLLFFTFFALLVFRLAMTGRRSLETSSAIGDRITKLLLIVSCLGTVSLLVGIADGFIMRSALRDYRFFVYTPVFCLYVRTAKLRIHDIWFMTVGLSIVVVVQTILILTGNLALSSTATGPAGLPIFQSYALDTGVSTELHWLPVWWSFPLLISASLLLTARLTMPRIALATLYSVVIGSLMILLLTYARGLMISTAAGMLVIFLVNPCRRGRMRLRLLALAVPAAIAAIWGAERLLESAGSQGIVSSVWSRYSLVSLAEGDRTEAFVYALREALGRPILGLGLGSPYEVLSLGGRLIHTGGGENGWIWVAGRVGFAGLIALLGSVYLAWRRGLRAIRGFSAQGPLPVGLAVGLLGCFAAMVVFISGSTMLLYFGASPFLGIWLGLLSQLEYLARANDHRTLNPASLPVRLRSVNGLRPFRERR